MSSIQINAVVELLRHYFDPALNDIEFNIYEIFVEDEMQFTCLIEQNSLSFSIFYSA